MQDILDKIIAGGDLVEIDRSLFFLKQPGAIDRNIANLIYQKELDLHKNNGRKTRKELEGNAIKLGVWKPEFHQNKKFFEEEKVSLLKDKKELEITNKNRKTPSSKLIKCLENLHIVENKIKHYNSLYNKYIEIPSAEYSAEKERAIYLIYISTYYFPSMRKVWNSYDETLNDENRDLIIGLINEYFTIELLEQKIIREVARSSFWRSKWTFMKNSESLFHRSVADLTMNQFYLVYWSQIYDAAYESLERPDDDIINNDIKFDSWLEEQSKKRKQKESQNSFERKLSEKAQNAQEVGVIIDGYYSKECNCAMSKEDMKLLKRHPRSCTYGRFIYHTKQEREKLIEKIQSSNPDQVRAILVQEQVHLEKHGDMIDEQNLRKSDKVRSIMGFKTKIGK